MQFPVRISVFLIFIFGLYSCATHSRNMDRKQAIRMKVYSEEATWQKNPENVELIRQDFDAFWQAVDTSRQPDGSFDSKIFRQTYQAHKTGQLDAYSELSYGTKEGLYESYDFIPFYESFRESMLQNILFPREKYILYLKNLQEYYPSAKFPNIFFYVGKMRQAGIALPRGLFIPVEIFQKNSTADYAQLPGNQKENELFYKIFSHYGIENLDAIMAHKLIRFQQQTTEGDFGFLDKLNQKDLLSRSLLEGCAEFLAHVISGKSSFAGDQSSQSRYGKSREGELWQEFKQDYQSNRNYSKWLYNFANKDRGHVPPDMGYWIGYRIAEAYWQNMADKQQAFYDILNWEDANEFLEKSGYNRLHSEYSEAAQ